MPAPGCNPYLLLSKSSLSACGAADLTFAALGLQPGWSHSKGCSVGYPNGMLSRLLLFWVTTEAVITKNRRLELGQSLAGFISFDSSGTSATEALAPAMRARLIRLDDLSKETLMKVLRQRKEFVLELECIVERWPATSGDILLVHSSMLSLRGQFREAVTTSGRQPKQALHSLAGLHPLAAAAPAVSPCLGTIRHKRTTRIVRRLTPSH